MTVHLLKLSVGSTSIESMAAWQARRLADIGVLFHRTRHAPRRAEEVLDGGSIYWVIQRFVLVRQRIIGIERAEDPDGIRCCHLLLDPELIKTRPQPRRPHQGWRYLQPADAPPDMGAITDFEDEPPPAMAAELRSLGLI
jgi:hypothetical protein